ncbi:MAG: diguanylate cyclase [Methylotenera sp.]|uniref:diguanylate cyclase n=1 Tax=Methylotenera sp. TaxID=2051956 RepID=UPI00248A65D8|nr:diguanylate cyclase [Methylotenera sp.]MDI1309477.1 diguanylate cyclase [Methylotenera sp.]
MVGFKDKSLRVIVPIAVLVLILNALIPINAYRILNVSHAKTNHSRETIDKATNLLLAVVDAETGMHGYVLTNNQKFLEPYYAALAKLDSQRDELNILTANRPNSKKSFILLANRIDTSLEQIKKIITISEDSNSKLAIVMIRSGEGKTRMDLVRASVADLIKIENQQLQLEAKYESKVNLYSLLSLIFLTIFDMVMFAIAFRQLFKSLKTAKEIEQELNHLHRLSLKHSAQLKARNKIKDIQARLTDQLHSVLTPQEAYVAIERFCTYLFPDNSGTLFIRSNSKDYFQMMAQWGNSTYEDNGFNPEDCWASRSNNTHIYIAETETIACNHLSNLSQKATASTCIPISSSDEMIGILTLYSQPPHEGGLDEDTLEVANEVASQISLAIANLRLRENLKKSSIIDVLTGLYNRRYLDETFIREINRSQRLKESIGIIMLDIDHFKSFNDNYGHEAGDHVLHEVGVILNQACRANDLACRYGGEEFVIVLLNADLNTTVGRATVIQDQVKKKQFMYGGQPLPTVTVSMGISMFPSHGNKPDQLIRCADEALYKAKHNGRDRVEIAANSIELQQ